jgi:hypothetical protein
LFAKGLRETKKRLVTAPRFPFLFFMPNPSSYPASNEQEIPGWNLFLGGILLLSLFLRWPYPGPEWIHVDEWQFVLRPLGFWSGDLHPHFFFYPTFQFYLASLLYYPYYLLFHGGRIEHFVAYRYFVGGEDLIGLVRGLHSLMAVGTVGVCAFLGRRLFGPLGGLLAALGLAAMPLAVRFAHLANTDTPMVLWVGLATLWGVRIVQEGRLSDCLWAGVFVGLAGGTKYPGALVALPVGLACWLRVSSLRDWGIWLSGGAAVLTFSLASPYVLLDAREALGALADMGATHVLSETHNSGASWTHMLRVNLRYGLGLVGLLMLIPGLFWNPRRRRPEEWVVVAGVLNFLLLLVVAKSDFMRYALPLAPLVAVLWVRPLLILAGDRKLLVLACVVLMMEPLYASWRTRSLLSGEDTRQQVKALLEEEVEGGCYIFQPVQGAEMIEGMSPKRLSSRQYHFLQSYDANDLQVAYEWLSRQEDLPLLLLHCGYRTGTQRLSKEGAEPGSTGWLVLLDHPRLMEEEPEERQWLMKRSLEIAEFSPGEMGGAVFDPVDWYFLPVGSFGGTERSGPVICLRRVPALFPVSKRGAGEYFEMLANLLVGDKKIAQGRWEEAVDCYQRVFQVGFHLPDILTKPMFYRLNYHSGLALFRLGESERSLEFLENAAEMGYDSGNLVGLFVVLGYTYDRIGRPEAAVDIWERVIELGGEGLDVHLFMGNDYALMGNWEAAVEEFQRALEFDPQSVETVFKLGEAFSALGKKEKARSCFEQVLSLDPAFPRAKENLEQLKM